jgi:hypothetical protein
MRGRIVCMFSGHQRSRGQARERGKIWVSVCKRCEAPMRQLSNRQWVADKEARKLLSNAR